MTDNKNLRLLEYDKILAMLAEQAETWGGREKCLNLTPGGDLLSVNEWLEQTEAALRLYNGKGGFMMHKLSDMTEIFNRLRAGGLLSIFELLELARLLSAARRLLAYRGADESFAGVLDDYFERLCPDKALEEKINRSFSGEGEVLDTASDELYAIRRKIQSAQARVRETLNKLIHSAKYQKALQETVITQRSGRFVVPVKAEYKAQVSGLVHDVSASGATLFIEPAGVVEANNEIRLLEGKEQHEIERILQELSALCAQKYEFLAENYEWLTFFDFLFAKARLAVLLRASRPVMNETGVIDFKRARHPLIPKEKVVAIDVALGGEYDTLIITGPNTGGKTVALKTVGLINSMAQSGLFIPCADSSRGCVFDRVLTDIGDEQSIEQSLSTFSAHMTNIVSIIGQATHRSLCLFDELGAGTDPIEGAALSAAILEYIRKKGARVVCTTHYPELKTYALETPGVRNASCEFDVATLRPTYRLITGVPGRSNAFAISEKLGLKSEIIEAAGERLSAESVAFEQVLAKIEHNRQQTEAALLQAQEEKQAAENAGASAREKARILEEQLNKNYESARGEGKRIVQAARVRVDAVLEELEALIKEKERADFKARVGAFKTKTRAAFKELDDEIDPVRESPVSYELPRPLKIGDTVEVVGIARSATVVELPDMKDKLRVSAGAMSFDVPLTQVRLLKKEKAGKTRKPYSPPVSSSAMVRSGSMEINVIGMTVAEMEPEVSKFIDGAVLAGLPSVTVVHGKGTGALRGGVWALLQNHPQVAGLRLGKFGEGEHGVTVVELKG